VEEAAIADFIASNCRDRDAAVADILNASGWDLAIKLRATFAKVTMFRLDHKFDSFSAAKNLGLGLEYGCIYNIAMADDSCGAVIWQNGDHDVNIEFALMELFRVLKPGGILVISGASASCAAVERFGLGEIHTGINVFTKEPAHC
jgi:SAM-dependent methyltransferase